MSIEEVKEKYLTDLYALHPSWKKWGESIRLAVDFAIKAHEGQYRKYDGSLFVLHPMAVSLNVAKYKDKEMVIAALLHDTVEDSNEVYIEMIYEKWGNDVWFMVEALTKEPLFFTKRLSLIYNDKVEKILAGGIEDVRILLLKIADRDHNLLTLQWLKPKKQIRMTFETQAIYEPLKKILLWWKYNDDIASIEWLFSVYLKNTKIVTATQLKKFLFRKMYHKFDDETYTMVYKDTASIIWKIEDKERFSSLLDHDEFNKKTEIISMETDGDYFIATFRFHEGYLLKKNKTGKRKRISIEDVVLSS